MHTSIVVNISSSALSGIKMGAPQASVFKPNKTLLRVFQRLKNTGLL